MSCEGRVIRVSDGVVHARLEVFVSLRAAASWRQSPAAAQLFMHMRPLAANADGSGAGDAALPRARSYYDLLREAAGPMVVENSGLDAFR